MARDLNGSSQYFELASAVVSAHPVTLAAWYNTDALSGFQYPLSISDASSRSTFRIAMNAFGSVIASVFQDDGNGGSSLISGNTAGAWHHLCGVFSGTSSRTVYLDGVAGTENTTGPWTPSGLDTTTVGSGIVLSTRSSYFNGRLAEIAVWNVALTANEVAALARGYTPNHFLRGLVGYWPLDDGEGGELDRSKWRRDLTEFGTVTRVPHSPRKRKDRRRVSVFVPAAGGGGGGTGVIASKLTGKQARLAGIGGLAG